MNSHKKSYTTDLYNNAPESCDATRTKTFLNIYFAIHEKYEELNRKRKEIDFEDMIVRAEDHVQKGRYQSKFKYILVDEFQDISNGRAQLILTLRNQIRGCHLFCVGDDWQSIYRFTGSDIYLMTKFEQVFGYTKRIDLDRTFRFNDKIESFSTRFILKNPSQLKKKLSPHSRVADPKIILQFSRRGRDYLNEILSDIKKESRGKISVFVLERYNFLIPSQETQDYFAEKYPRLHISYLTAHSSKGLEADYVIVDNLNSGRYGFPTGMIDDPLLSLVLSEPEQYEHSEERRLFYVSVTRARKKVYLVADLAIRSIFVQELMSDTDYNVR